MIHKSELFRNKVHNNILISLLKNNSKNYFEITNNNTELNYNMEELSDTKSLISYNINRNDNVEVIFRITKVVDEKKKSLKQKL